MAWDAIVTQTDHLQLIKNRHDLSSSCITFTLIYISHVACTVSHTIEPLWQSKSTNLAINFNSWVNNQPSVSMPSCLDLVPAVISLFGISLNRSYLKREFQLLFHSSSRAQRAHFACILGAATGKIFWIYRYQDKPMCLQFTSPGTDSHFVSPECPHKMTPWPISRQTLKRQWLQTWMSPHAVWVSIISILLPS